MQQTRRIAAHDQTPGELGRIFGIAMGVLTDPHSGRQLSYVP